MKAARIFFRAIIALALMPFAASASFGPLTPSAAPYEREYIWPEGKMPDVQPHQIAAKTGESQAPGFKADDFRLRPESPALKLGFKPIDVSTVGRIR